MSDQLLIALVASVQETRRGPKVWLQILRGSLSENDYVEVVHSNGTSTQLYFQDVGKKPVTPDSFAGLVAGGGAGPFKQEDLPPGVILVGDLIRAPGGVPVEIDPNSELAREIAEARSAGRLATFGHLDDATIGLHVQWLMNQALKDSKGVVTGSGSYNAVAKTLASYGLQEQADRAALIASALLEGYNPGAAVKGLASLGAGVLNAVSFPTPAYLNTLALALEEGEAFAASYRKSLAFQGAQIRLPIMEAGRAVAVGWCKKCDDITELDAKLRCKVCRKESGSYRVVVARDRELAEIDLRTEGPPKRGLFGW